MRLSIPLSALLTTILVAGCDSGSSTASSTGSSDARVLASKCRPILRQMSVLEQAYHQVMGRPTTDFALIGMTPPEDPTYSYSISLPAPGQARMKAVVKAPFGSVSIGDSAFLTVALAPEIPSDTFIHGTGGLAAYYP